MIDLWGSDGFDRVSFDPAIFKESERDPLALKLLWFKSSGGSNNVDKAYNARMATIAEAQQDMAEEYFAFWNNVYKPLETAQASADLSLVGSETALAKAQNEANLSLVDPATAAQRAEYESTSALIPAQTNYALQAMDDSSGVRSAYYQEALEGVDVESRANKAAADAAQAFMNTSSQTNRSAARMGVNPNSGRFAAMANQNNIDQAKAVSSAKTQARTAAEQENFGRLASAMSTTVSV